jgi:soluble lytic murein transglycosylase-like protein
VDPELIHAVIRQESGYDLFAVSRKGARGLMQLMPQTALELGVKDIFDPAENVYGGVQHLRRLLDRYDGDRRLALAAYNAGEGAVKRYGGVPPYPETVDYVSRIARSWGSDEPVASGGEPQEPIAMRPRIVESIGDDGAIRYETARR